jgi:hypothetical protein
MGVATKLASITVAALHLPPRMATAAAHRNTVTPQIGKTPNVRPKAPDSANCFGSVPLQFPSNTDMSVDLSLSPSS